jgi:AraC-like DNA-binding protein
MADALNANPGDRSTVSQWAKRLAMSERSLARLVVSETGLTFGRWRQQLQLLVAVRELAGGASVQRVSDELGYESVTAFITMFKKALGHSPGRYFAALARTQSEAGSRRRLRPRWTTERMAQRTLWAVHEAAPSSVFPPVTPGSPRETARIE